MTNRRARLCLRFVLACAVASMAASCAIDENGKLVPLGEPVSTKSKTAAKKPGADTTSKYYSPSHYIYVNERQIAQLTPSNARIEIDLGDQRARIFKTGGGRDQLMIETQISTGRQGHDTPDGDFKVMEKSMTKKSNLYGVWVDGGDGSLLVKDGDSRNHPGNAGAEFQGTPMPYWMRVTPGGVGMHVGYVPSYPASHGCIRVPKQVQPLIYEKVKVGTPVHITH
ncbi:MAG: L,D-transpeptidase family protein [Akkermansiaceae bacterium]|nr:L,D-transpeptidase family protein [Akkermansiaceae bacterium]